MTGTLVSIAFFAGCVVGVVVWEVLRVRFVFLFLMLDPDELAVYLEYLREIERIKGGKK